MCLAAKTGELLVEDMRSRMKLFRLKFANNEFRAIL